jgi:crotonobetainyl-CoA:carnitine CoA-transferase CaiB-like acyl-CoA transferase
LGFSIDRSIFRTKGAEQNHAKQDNLAVSGPFDGIRVVDLSDRCSGAFAARLFGDFGAEVVLAETAEGHPLRHEPPFLDDEPHPDKSVLHAYLNWNKGSHVYSSPAELEALLVDADIVITNSDAQAGFDQLPGDAVLLSITAHGPAGPLADRAGNNLTTSARSGWSYINGFQDEAPLQMPREQVGYVGGVTGFICAAAALRRRTDSSVAERVEVSELEAFALTVHPWGIAAIYNDTGYSNGPAGRRPRGKPAPLWDLADGRMHFGIADFHNWRQAMEVLQLPGFGNQENLQPDIGRHSQNLSEVVAGMARTLPSLSRWPVFHSLAQLRCVIGVVQDVEDLGHDEQLLARQFLVETRIDGRTVRAAGAPAKLHPTPWKLSRPAPQLNESNRQPNRDTNEQARTATVKRTPASAANPADGPLSGLRVLSFGQAWSGTFGTELLALLGADVVQIGSLHRPDVWRRVANNVPAGLVDSSRTQHALNTQGLYNSVNLNKREITLDLRNERGRELFWELIPEFDVLADNFRPNVLPSWGVSLEKLHELRPGMIWASISGYGADGPYSEYPANGATTEPMSGFSSLHGYQGDEGMNTGGLYPDPIGGYFLVATIMAALQDRDRTGEAQRVDLSMMEAVSTVCGDAFVEFDATGTLPKPIGNHHPRLAPHNNYQTRNGEWLALAVESDRDWQSLVAYMHDDRAANRKFDTMQSRKSHEAQLDDILADWCSTRDATELEAALGTRGLLAARVVPLYELYSRPDPNLVASGFVTRVDHPETGPTWLPGRPWRFSGATASPVRAAPCVGEHSREILVQDLGLEESEYLALVAAGVTGTLNDLPSNQ